MPCFQNSRFSDFQAPPALRDELSDPNPTPLPTHPGIKYIARSQEPLLRSILQASLQCAADVLTTKQRAQGFWTYPHTTPSPHGFHCSAEYRTQASRSTSSFGYILRRCMRQTNGSISLPRVDSSKGCLLDNQGKLGKHNLRVICPAC